MELPRRARSCIASVPAAHRSERFTGAPLLPHNTRHGLVVAGPRIKETRLQTKWGDLAIVNGSRGRTVYGIAGQPKRVCMLEIGCRTPYLSVIAAHFIRHRGRIWRRKCAQLMPCMLGRVKREARGNQRARSRPARLADRRVLLAMVARTQSIEYDGCGVLGGVRNDDTSRSVPCLVSRPDYAWVSRPYEDNIFSDRFRQHNSCVAALPLWH
jgi:hypothetical protein